MADTILRFLIVSKRKWQYQLCLVAIVLCICVTIAMLHIFLYYGTNKEMNFKTDEEKIVCAITQPIFEAVRSTPLKCQQNHHSWVNIRGGKFELLRQTANCHFQEILRNGDQSFSLSPTIMKVQHGASVSKQFMAFQCNDTDRNQTKHEETRFYVLRNESIVKAKKSKRKQKKYAWNIYFLGFDSVSKVQFEAQAPKTLDFLKNQMHATILQQYNIVGDGTPQAFLPILTGKTEEEMPLTRRRYKNASFVNVYPFVWNDFAKQGYYTSFSETDPVVGTYQYRLKGFNEQPTDFYPRQFFQKAWKHYVNFCLGNKPEYQALFNVGEGIFGAYPDLPKFVLTFSGMTHSGPVLDLADEDLAAHLQKMWTRYNSTTIFIVMSDHGPRYGSIRSSLGGKLREIRPFMSFSFPPTFKIVNPGWIKNLEANVNKLTTPFDIHSTLLDILDGSSTLRKDVVKGRSLSLFGKIPSSRTCSQAGVPPFFCGCLERKWIKPDTPNVVKGVKQVMATINKQTEHERKLCIMLDVNIIINASVVEAHERMLKFKKTVDYDGFQPDYSDSNVYVNYRMYEAKFNTKPGNNVYEGYFAINKETGSIEVDIKQISIVNAYGSNPHCVQDRDAFLRQWCVCYDKV